VKNIFKRILVFILGICLLFFVDFTSIYVALRYGSIWDYNADFKSCKTEFTLVADYISQNYPNSNHCFFVHHKSGKTRLYDYHTSRYHNTPDEIGAALDIIIEKGFPNGSFSLIRVEGNRISFELEAVAYNLVYSPDGRPTYLVSPDETCEVHAKRITGHWYHVSGI